MKFLEMRSKSELSRQPNKLAVETLERKPVQVVDGDVYFQLVRIAKIRLTTRALYRRHVDANNL